MSKLTNRVFCDMDGVLADFERTAQEILGPDYNWKDEVEKPHWGKVGEIQDIYSRLHVMNGAHMLMDYLRNNFDKVEILTAIPKRASFPTAVNDKRNWIHKHFGSEIRVNFGPYAEDKQYHIRDMHDILIDDMVRNIDQWHKRGGIGFTHVDARDTIFRMQQYFNHKE